MKFINLKSVLYLLLAFLFILPVSCIKDSFNEQQDKETKIIQNFLKSSDGTGFTALLSGCYERKVPPMHTGVSPTKDDFVIISYNAIYLENRFIFDTTDSAEAKNNSIQNITWLASQGPLKTAINNDYHFYPTGVNDVLLTMKEGDSSQIVCPGNLGFGAGYYIPTLFSVKLIKVIPDPKQFEIEQISKYLATKGKTIADSTGKGGTGA